MTRFASSPLPGPYAQTPSSYRGHWEPSVSPVGLRERCQRVRWERVDLRLGLFVGDDLIHRLQAGAAPGLRQWLVVRYRLAGQSLGGASGD